MEGEINIDYIIASKNEADLVYDIVFDTVKTIYPKYYTKEVVDFFLNYHSRENIIKDIENGLVAILFDNSQAVGCAGCEGNYIKRVYVRPQYQGRGYGSFLMQKMEEEIAKKYDSAILDASLPAICFYEKRGYKTIRHDSFNVESSAVLVYDIMEKYSAPHCQDRFFVFFS